MKRLIRYFQLRLQGFTSHAAAALTPVRGDKSVGLVSLAVFLWLMADSLGAVL